MPLWENWVDSFFLFEIEGLQESSGVLDFFQVKKDSVLKLGGFQQFENSLFRSQKFQYSSWKLFFTSLFLTKNRH
jgi:hypothetical protein